MDNNCYVIGLDYGSDSVRAGIFCTSTGREVGTYVHKYTRWSKGKYCISADSQFRQHPLDYLEGLEIVIRKSLEQAPKDTSEKIKAISIATTGSTPVAVSEDGTPLALQEEFAENPNAMFILWKDHTAMREAEEINRLSKTWGGVNYTKYSGGIYSSEWFWSKILHVLRKDEQVRKAAFSWVEHCDWLPGLLTGNTNPLTIKRGRCSAGHKAMWHEDFGGLPSDEFLTNLDPLLNGLRDRLYTETFTADVPVGYLTEEWAEKLGLSTNVLVGSGAFDAHMGAVGGQIKAYSLIKVMGTSTCDMLISPLEETENKLVKGICGQVNGSIVPGMLGMEAGQSAFGDLYAWYKEILLWPIENILDDNEVVEKEGREKLIKEISQEVLAKLDNEAKRLAAEESEIIALDWINGRRSPDSNQALKAAIFKLNMGSDAVKIYRALVEATAFGAKKIVNRFIEEGIVINEVIALGGVAKKSEFVMQILADVLGLEIKVVESDQACALGAAMFAAVIAGFYPTVSEAQDYMGSGFCKTYIPDQKNTEKYKKQYAKYEELGNFMEEAIFSD